MNQLSGPTSDRARSTPVTVTIVKRQRRQSGPSPKEQRAPNFLWISLVDAFLFRKKAKRVNEVHFQQVRRVLDRFTMNLNLWNASVHQISQLDIQRYVAGRSCDEWAPPGTQAPRRKLSARTINNEIDIINSVFQYAGPRANMKGHRDNLGILTDPPYFSPLAEEEPVPVSISKEQLAAFEVAIKHARSPRRDVCDPVLFWRAVLVLGLTTALRRGALLSILRPSDEILINQRQLILTAEISKNRRAEIITLGNRKDVIDLLISLPSKPGEPLLPWKMKNGNCLSLNHFNKVLREFQIASGGDAPIKTKYLRSTAATLILDEQFSTDTARKRLGHKSEGIIRKHYQARTVNDADRAVSDLLANQVMGLFVDVNAPVSEIDPEGSVASADLQCNEIAEAFDLFRE